MEHLVSLVRYEKPYESVKKAIELAGGFGEINKNTKVFIKPNIVFWTKETNFPKWGVITSSRVIKDVVSVLKDFGVDDITLGEGIVSNHIKDSATPAHAFETLGYNTLKKRFGLKVINVFEHPFRKIQLGDGIALNYNIHALESDMIIDLPVLKTHAQAVVSLGIKNLKGLIDVNSRKKCHSKDSVKDLNYTIARLPEPLPPVFTLIDGIFSLERGPGFDGKAHRSNILVASKDIYSADKVGAKLLGYEPSDVPHLVHALKRKNRVLTLQDTVVVGGSLKELKSRHEYTFPYTKDNSLPLPLYRLGIKGLRYPKYDLTICTYCSNLNGIILYSIARAWKGHEWDGVEILTGKSMRPTLGMKKTVLLGKCMYSLNKNDPNIQELIAVKGCPPDPEEIVDALHKAGIPVDPTFILRPDLFPGVFMAKYEGRPEFDEGFFRIS